MKFGAIIYLATASTSFAAQTLLKVELWSGTETCTGTAASKGFYQFDRCKVAHGTVHSIWTSTGNTITTKSYILDTNCTGTASSTTDYTSGTCQNSTTAGNRAALHSIDSTTMPDSLVAITTIALMYMTSTTCSGDYTCPLPATNGLRVQALRQLVVEAIPLQQHWKVPDTYFLGGGLSKILSRVVSSQKCIISVDSDTYYGRWVDC